MVTVLRFAQMYTNINILFLLIWILWGESAYGDVLRANSLLILFAVSYLWITGTNWQFYLDFYTSLSGPNLERTTVIYLSMIVDLLAHLLPVLIIGLPITRPIFSVGVASICALLWYLALRRNNRIQNVYVDTLPVETYDVVLLWGLSISIYVAFLLEHIKN